MLGSETLGSAVGSLTGLQHERFLAKWSEGVYVSERWVCSAPVVMGGSRPEQRHRSAERERHHRSVKEGPEGALQRGHPLVDGRVHRCHVAGVLPLRLPPIHDAM